MEPIDEATARAMKRGDEAAATQHRAVGARFDTARTLLVLEFEGKVELAIPPGVLGLPLGVELADVRLEGGGFDLYFPSIDEGAFVPDVVRAAIAPHNWPNGKSTLFKTR